jgi:cytidyltransferase-like protein
MRQITTIGIYGGTFDPIHLGHLYQIQDALKSLDYVSVFVSDEHPYGKQPLLSYETRYSLANKAIQDFFGSDSQRVILQSIRFWKKVGLIPSEHTIHLLEKYRDEKSYRRNPLVWVPHLMVGSDISNEEILTKWKDGDKVLQFPQVRSDRTLRKTGIEGFEFSSTDVKRAALSGNKKVLNELVLSPEETFQAITGV